MPHALVAATAGPDLFAKGDDGRCGADNEPFLPAVGFATVTSTAWFSLATSTGLATLVFVFVATNSTFAAVRVRKGERLAVVAVEIACGASEVVS